MNFCWVNHCYTSPKPEEFEKAGLAWNEVGWRVDVQFTRLPTPIRPSLHMEEINPTLQDRYSPIRETGHGNQERFCRITLVERAEHLIASHIKPWRESNNEERLEQANGLLLTPTIDHLFDRGFISFENNGELLVSPVPHPQSLLKMGVATDRVVNVGGIAETQKELLEFHRSKVFLNRPLKTD